VFYDLQVPDFSRDPVMLSGVLLTAATANATFTAQPDPETAKVLPGPATARRTFSRNDIVTVFAEIYDNSSRRQPRQVDTAVTLISETGQEVFNARDSIATGDWSAYGLRRDIPLKDVAAGRYLLRVEARLRGSDTSAVQETLMTVQQ
jgi:hypothetical protein